MPKGDLTPKREAFALRYVEIGNASEAYRLAFDAEKSTDKSVWEAASRLLADAKVAARVAELKEMHRKRHCVTVDRVLKEYARLGFLDIRKAFDEGGKLKPVRDLDDDTAAAIAGIEVEELWEGRGESREQVGRLHKLKLSDKKAALDSIARHLGMFNDKLELSGRLNITHEEFLEQLDADDDATGAGATPPAS